MVDPRQKRQDFYETRCSFATVLQNGNKRKNHLDVCAIVVCVRAVWLQFFFLSFFFKPGQQRLCAEPPFFCTYHSARRWFYLFALMCSIVSVLFSVRVNCCEAKQRKAVVYLCRTIRGTKICSNKWSRDWRRVQASW